MKLLGDTKGKLMPAIATPEVLFLFEDEVREAGRRLATLRELRRNYAGTPEGDAQIENAIVDALNVCMVALAGAEKDDACLMMARKPDLGLAPNVGGEARLAAHQPPQTTTATPQGVASTDQLGRASEARN